MLHVDWLLASDDLWNTINVESYSPTIALQSAWIHLALSINRTWVLEKVFPCVRSFNREHTE